MMFKEFKQAMIGEFEMMDNGLISWFLGIEVMQSKEDIFISQDAYVNGILKRFKMEDCKLVCTSVECETKLSKHDDGVTVDPTYFKSLVESLRYLICTRSDILYGVGLISHFMEEPRSTHLKVAK